jgi:hypothetical protein
MCSTGCRDERNGGGLGLERRHRREDHWRAGSRREAPLARLLAGRRSFGAVDGNRNKQKAPRKKKTTGERTERSGSVDRRRTRVNGKGKTDRPGACAAKDANERHALARRTETAGE